MFVQFMYYYVHSVDIFCRYNTLLRRKENFQGIIKDTFQVVRRHFLSSKAVEREGQKKSLFWNGLLKLVIRGWLSILQAIILCERGCEKMYFSYYLSFWLSSINNLSLSSSYYANYVHCCVILYRFSSCLTQKICSTKYFFYSCTILYDIDNTKRE